MVVNGHRVRIHGRRRGFEVLREVQHGRVVGLSYETPLLAGAAVDQIVIGDEGPV
jgi:hypothetical protein